MSGSIRVRGEASAEEVVAVLAALARREEAGEPSAYERWRAGRLRALRTAATGNTASAS